MSAPQAALPQHDPLAAILRIEGLVRSKSAEWDDLREAYCDALVALASQLRAHDEKARTDLLGWLESSLEGLFHCRDPAMRVTRRDALHDIVFEGEATGARLERAAERCRSRRVGRANLLSFLKFALIHGARDIHRSRRGRFEEREALADESDDFHWWPDRTPMRRARAGVLLGQIDRNILRRMHPDESQAIHLFLWGETIAEAARRTGLSRQAIYRRLEYIRAAVDAEGVAP